MQTMDVVYPASPMLLWSDPELLRLLLIPVLEFANNATWHPFTNPFSPHQIGRYPIANATTADQEPMPMENTGGKLVVTLIKLPESAVKSLNFAPITDVLSIFREYVPDAPRNSPAPGGFELATFV